MLSNRLILLIFCCIAVPLIVDADGLQGWGIGQRVPGVTLQDQFEQTISLDESTRLILFAPDRAAAKLVHRVLEAERGVLSFFDKEVRYVADISGMPGWVSRFFALPKMKKYGYSVALERHSSECAMIPRHPEHVSIISVSDDGVISAINFTKDPGKIQTCLKPFLPSE